jgi:hypothetical protein
VISILELFLNELGFKQLALAKLHNYCIDEDCQVTPGFSYISNDEGTLNSMKEYPLLQQQQQMMAILHQKAVFVNFFS